MKLFYKGEYLKEITPEKFEELKNYKGPQVVVDGQLFEKSKLTTRKKIEIQDRMISDYTPEELRLIVGSFEEEYNRNATGKVISSGILGIVRQGTVDQALKIGAITKKNNVYYIKLPEYYSYQKKYNAMRELIVRREYAKSKVGGQ